MAVQRKSRGHGPDREAQRKDSRGPAARRHAAKTRKAPLPEATTASTRPGAAVKSLACRKCARQKLNWVTAGP